MKQYDTDDTGTFNHLEITAMLDSLGSTLSRETLNSWFSRLGRDPMGGELSVTEVIQYLEEETRRPASQKKRLGSQDDAATTSPSGLTTPSTQPVLQPDPLNLEKMDFSGPKYRRSPEQDGSLDVNPDQAPGNVDVVGSLPVPAGPYLRNRGNDLPTATDIPKQPQTEQSRQQSSSSEGEEYPLSGSEESIERIINIKTCPLCHRPRLGSKGEMDIITHVAVCASQDWERVDRITVGNFVTASQAQRKWYTKALAKLSTGAYSVGAVCITILLDRGTNPEHIELC